MSLTSNIKIFGIRDFEKTILKMPQDIRRGATAAILRAGGNKIAKAAKAKAPRRKTKIGLHSYDPGMLKRSIGVNVKNIKGEITARIGARSKLSKAVGIRTKGKDKGKTIYQTPARYSHLVEYGTAHSPAQPFLRPAVESTASEVVSEMAKGLSKYLDNYVRRMKRR